MSTQYNDSYGRAPLPSGGSRDQASMESAYPGGAPDPRYRPRPPPQQSTPPLGMMEPAATYYSGRNSPVASPEQWPLPALPLGQGSPRPSSPSAQSPKKPPPRPPRESYHDPMIAQYRQNARMAPPPGYGQHPRGPPRQRPPQWAGDGYMSAARPYSPSSGPRRPPPMRPPQSPYMDLQMSPRAMYQQQRPPRPPHGMPPPGRRPPPAGYYEQRGPVAAVAMREGADIVTPPPSDGALSPFTPPHAQKNVPSYYFEQRGNSPAPNTAPKVAPIAEHVYHDSPMEPHLEDTTEEVASEPRDEASPEPTTIIRQASLGKKTRPTLTTIKGRNSSGESATAASSTPPDQPSSREQLTPFEEEIEQIPGAWISEGPTPAAESTGSHAIDTTEAVAGAERDVTEKTSPSRKASHRRSSDILGQDGTLRNISPVPTRTDATGASIDMGASVISPILAHTQLAQPMSPLSPSSQDNIPTRPDMTPNSTTELRSPDSRWSEESEKRKLKDLTIDMGKVREAEARGSITSLPDLIRRATKLASNLDRGKTASRMGLNFFDFNSSSDAVEKLRAAENKNRRSGSLSDMLTAFPAPGSRDGARASKGNFSNMLRRSQIPSESDNAEFQEKKTKRKCCGLSPGLFVLLLIILFLLVAAAVIIPVVLVVLPKQNNSNTAVATPSNPALAKCESQITCQNGGLNIIGSGGSCSCLCINGYTGKTCTTLSKSGCTTTSAGSTKNATVGEDIPRLIAGGNSNFTIPLDGETLLGLFSKNDLSCTSENALVTFSQSAQDTTPVIVRDTLDLDSSLAKRQEQNKIIDFARVAVLYIFQQTSELDSAAKAQDVFQSYFMGRQTNKNTIFNPRNITLGSGFSCDLTYRSLVWTLKNGSTVAS